VELPRLGDASRIALAELAMNFTCLLAISMLGHKQGKLVAMVEVIEVHDDAPRA
jgi:hypothetical protein